MHYLNQAILQNGPPVFFLGRGDPNIYARIVGGHPQIDFFWKGEGKKRRLVGNPNKASRLIHKFFGEDLELAIARFADYDGYVLRKLPSATGCVLESNHLLNAKAHELGKFFYITDFRGAYPSLDLSKLATLLVYLFSDTHCLYFGLKRIVEHASQEELRNDPLYEPMLVFLELNCSGIQAKGLAVGAPLSPLLMNLYCEVYVDRHIRKICEDYKITYTRYVDDLVFSRRKPIFGDLRRMLREVMGRAGFEVNHRKSFVLSRAMGTVFVTKIGLRVDTHEHYENAILVFPQKKRRKLQGMIRSYLVEQFDDDRKISGYVGEFIYYLKNTVSLTRSDEKTFALCRAFLRELSKYTDTKRRLRN